MGAKNCPETPRQKLISMMYLVLTGLLALNVSAEIINAFVIFDEALTKSTETLADKNKTIITQFKAANQENPDKVGSWKKKADKIVIISDKMYDYLRDIKIEVLTASGDIKEGADPDKADLSTAGLNKKSDLNVGGQVMIGPNYKGKAFPLKEKIIEYKKELLKIVNNKGTEESIEKTLSTEDPKSKEGEQKTWELQHFDQLPLAAVTTIITKLQSDVRSAESDVLNYLYGQITAGDIPFNKIEAIVKSKSNYVLQGNEYEAQIFIAASDSTSEPTIMVGDYDTVRKDGTVSYEMVGEKGKDYIELDSLYDGKGVYVSKENSVGYKTLKGLIKLQTNQGDMFYPYESEYQVAQGGIVVSPTKMNVFYIGVNNPVDVSVPGVPKDKIRPSMSGGGGSIRASGDGYVVRCSTPTNDAYINVSAEINGENKNMGRMRFRVKRVPDPVAKVANKKDGIIKKAVLLAQSGVLAEMENFDFEVRSTVVKFDVAASVKGFFKSKSSTSSRFTPAQKALIKQLRSGDRVFIEKVYAKLPDGTTRKLNSVNLKIK